MLIRELETELPPEFHDELLVVRFRPDLGNVAASAMAMAAGAAIAMVTLESTVAGAAWTAATQIAPSLLAMERSGLIRRVVPLIRSETPAALDAASAVLSSFGAEKNVTRLGSAIASGTAFVQLEKGVDVHEARRRLSDDAQVQFVSRVPLRYMALPTAKPRRRPPSPSTAAAPPPAPSGLWNLLKVQWATARNKSEFVDADNVKVAILDTGVDNGHPDLMVTQYIHDHPDTPHLSGIKDIAGHGTHVAGTVAATIGNAAGINGICRCRLMCWKIFNDQTVLIRSQRRFTYVVDPLMYQRALADCLDEDVDVINLSIGGTQPPDPQERQLLNALLANGTTIVAAMGNHRHLGSLPSFPAAVPDVIAVGATSIDDSVATFSNRGDHITISAPGVSIWSTMPTYSGQSGFDAVIGAGDAAKEGKAIPRETNYAALDGTSMATPHVTAAAALLIAKKGRLGPTATANALQASSDRVAGMGGLDFHPDYGSGRLNLDRLL
jgi:hypothetical protein